MSASMHNVLNPHSQPDPGFRYQPQHSIASLPCLAR